MTVPTSETSQRIKEVAKLRVEGLTWDKVAVRYGYASGDSARHVMTQEHPELWRAAYEEARVLFLDEIEAEATLTQRALLRNMDMDLRQRAAHSLLNHCSKLRAQKLEVSGDLRHTGKLEHQHAGSLDIRAEIGEWATAVAGADGPGAGGADRAPDPDRDAQPVDPA